MGETALTDSDLRDFAPALTRTGLQTWRRPPSFRQGLLAESKYRLDDPPIITLTAFDDHSSWLVELVQNVNAAGRLPSGWDSYGGEQLAPKAAYAALDLLEHIEFRGPAPMVSPSPDGALHLEWSNADLMLAVQVSGGGDVLVLFEEGDAVDEWTTGLYGDDKLRAAVRRLLDSLAD
jgi:hypothetical protein